MTSFTLLSLIRQSAAAIPPTQLDTVAGVAKGVFEQLPLTAQQQLEANARTYFTDTSFGWSPINTTELGHYGVMAMAFTLLVEIGADIQPLTFVMNQQGKSLALTARGYALTERLLANIPQELQYYALCRMSIHTSCTDTDAAVVMTLSSRMRFREALLAASQSFMHTTGYDEGFVAESMDYRIEPENITEITESDAQSLVRLLNLRHWPSLDACGYDTELVAAVMAQDD